MVNYLVHNKKTGQFRWLKSHRAMYGMYSKTCGLLEFERFAYTSVIRRVKQAGAFAWKSPVGVYRAQLMEDGQAFTLTEIPPDIRFRN